MSARRSVCRSATPTGHGTSEVRDLGTDGCRCQRQRCADRPADHDGPDRRSDTLTARIPLADADGWGAFSYQWYRDGVAIGGATGTTYTLVDADVGARSVVQCSYTDDRAPRSVSSAGRRRSPTSTMHRPAVSPSAARRPRIRSDGRNTLADADGLGAISYQWYRDGVAISGATGRPIPWAMPMSAPDHGHRQLHRRSGHQLKSVTSAGVGPIANVNDAPVACRRSRARYRGSNLTARHAGITMPMAWVPSVTSGTATAWPSAARPAAPIHWAMPMWARRSA